jgi:hypothetical protein
MTTPTLASISGPVVIIGFGSIGRGTLPLLDRHIDFDRSRCTVIDPDDSDRAILDEYGVRYLRERITPENHRDVLTTLLTEGSGQGFCINLSVDTSSLDIMRLCRRARGALHRHGRGALARLLLRRQRPTTRHAPTMPCARRCSRNAERTPGARPRCRAAARIPAWCRGS